MRQLSSDEARAFHRALNAEGVDAVVVAEDNLTALPKKVALQRIELTDADLVVFDQIGRPEKFPWGEVSLLALGAVTHFGISHVTKVGTKLNYNPATGVWPKETVEHSHKLAKDSQFLIEIVLDSSGKRFRINAAEFPFRYVVDRPEFSLVDKTVWLAGELIRRAPHALLNRGARDVRDGVKLVRGYPTPQVFNDEMVWLLWDQAQRAR